MNPLPNRASRAQRVKWIQSVCPSSTVDMLVSLTDAAVREFCTTLQRLPPDHPLLQPPQDPECVRCHTPVRQTVTWRCGCGENRALFGDELDECPDCGIPWSQIRDADTHFQQHE